MKATYRFHTGARLCITACDSTPIRPTAEEEAQGWEACGNVMASPPLVEGLDLPHDEYDEWYLLAQPPLRGWQPEIFVNYGGFTLVAIEEIYRTFDPTWYSHGLDYLVPIQERFWAQIREVDPISHIGMGDFDVVVSNCREFIAQLRADA